MSAFSLLADIVIVNMLLVLSSLPVVTAGMALRAANVVTGQMVQGVGSRYGLRYLKAFNEQRGPATAWWLTLLGLGCALAYQQWVVFQAGITGVALTVIQALVLAGVFILVGISVWFFALQSVQRTPLAVCLSTSTLLTFRHLPRTAAAVALVAGACALPFFLNVAVWVPLYFFAVPAMTLFLIRLVLAAPLGHTLDAR